MKKKSLGVLAYFARHNAEFGQLVGYSRAKDTYARYCVVFRHLERYIRERYGKRDLPLEGLQSSFISGFDIWLRSERGLAPNSVWGYMISLKHVLTLARNEGLMTVNPFCSYVNTYFSVDRGYLSEEELVRLLKAPVKTEMEELVRDLFLFSAFTGLSYIDIRKLHTENLQQFFDGHWWIVTRRQKTHVASSVRLLDVPLRLVEKYRDTAPDGLLFPVPSNSYCNKQLKRLGARCGIRTRLTFHVGRHTFATLALNRGMPIETLSRILGHTNIRTTQIYARITDKTISRDMAILANGLVRVERDICRRL